ncbi:MAG: hypothetical protein WAO02_18585 [Verrucomicrobiia bacterium]
MKINPAIKFSSPVILPLVIVLLAGCATTVPIDWNSRVGHYTYDQAVAELGAPSRQAKLGDGELVSKWSAQPNVGAGAGVNSGMSYYGSSGFVGAQPIGPGANDRMLQLTFGTNGVLTSWSKNY